MAWCPPDRLEWCPMKKTAHASSKLAQSPDSSPKSVGSVSPVNPPSQTAYSHPPKHRKVLELEDYIKRARNQDLAYWGGFVIEDLGIVDVDRVVGSSEIFGSDLRALLCSPSGELNVAWSETATRLYLESPAMSNIQSLFAGMCQLAASHWYVRRSTNGCA